ncbi:MAG: hypothetical protein J5611_01630 [Alphaproteobacteria bacterium]|nr:hypothetical protein [Alphaproteobacteria bacterium]
MSMFLKTSAVCIATAMCASSASAALFGLMPDGVQMGLGFSGTSGLNGFVGYANKNFESFWWKRLGFRIDFASTSPVQSKINSEIREMMNDKAEGIEITDDLRITNGTVSAKHFGAIVDFYPFGDTWFLGGWRISGGYFNGKMHLGAEVQSDRLPSGDYEFELNDIKYKYAGGEMHATSKADWNYRGPYVGTGFDIGLLWGLKIYVDAGVVFANKSAQLGLDVPTNGLYQWYNGAWEQVAGDDPLQQQLQATLEDAKREILRDGQKELDKYKFYPLVKVGLMYRF